MNLFSFTVIFFRALLLQVILGALYGLENTPYMFKMQKSRF